MNDSARGFTLIELSIVLVIIGLIVGGILVGQSLIGAAAVRAQISQIEKYNTAVNTFRGKYGYLPGDIPNPYAPQFGLQTRGTYEGEGDGNGIIEGIDYNAPGAAHYCGWCSYGGETVMFWVDLGAVNLIADGLNTATTTNSLGVGPLQGSMLKNYFPQAKIGQGNFIYVYSNNSNNYYGLGVISGAAAGVISGPGLTVQQAYAIDQKMDDGLPESGNVQAIDLPDTSPYPVNYSPTGSSATCIDQRGGTTLPQYSLEISNGSNVTCALQFTFQ